MAECEPERLCTCGHSDRDHQTRRAWCVECDCFGFDLDWATADEVDRQVLAPLWAKFLELAQREDRASRP